MERLAPRFHVLAVDSHDWGRSPAWPSDRVITLSDEAALIEPALERAGSPVTLVGHSYGAAVALLAALADPATPPDKVNPVIGAASRSDLTAVSSRRRRQWGGRR